MSEIKQLSRKEIYERVTDAMFRAYHSAPEPLRRALAHDSNRCKFYVPSIAMSDLLAYLHETVTFTDPKDLKFINIKVVPGYEGCVVLAHEDAVYRLDGLISRAELIVSKSEV